MPDNEIKKELKKIQKQINDLQHKMIDQQSLYNSKTMYKTELENLVKYISDLKLT